MEPTNGNEDKWEQQARTLFAPLAVRVPKDNPELTDRILGQIHASICICDIAELATTVFVKEHIGSIIGALADLCIQDKKGKPTHD